MRRAGVLVVTSDRGLCGGYNANAIRTAEQLISRLRDEGKQVALYVVGRKGVTYYRFRNRTIDGELDRLLGAADLRRRHGDRGHADPGVPGRRRRRRRGRCSRRDDGVLGVDELHIVHTQFRSLMTQNPVANFLAPMQVEEKPADVVGPLPAYEFEPDPEMLLDALLPKYINTRIYAALIDAAASESAARRRAMKSATDNAEEMIKSLTREMNTRPSGRDHPGNQ